MRRAEYKLGKEWVVTSESTIALREDKEHSFEDTQVQFISICVS